MSLSERWESNHPFVGILPSRWRKWIDHDQIEWLRGKKVYVANPYYLNAEDLEDLQKLRDSGFTVGVTGHSDYSPSTIRVEVSRG